MLDDGADVIWYVRPPSGGQYGPATSGVMKTWLGEGRITPNSQVWREGWRDWKEAAVVFPEADFPQLRVADAVPGLDRILETAGPGAGAIGASPLVGTGRRASRHRVLVPAIFAVLGVGVLAGVYFLARYLGR